MSASTALTSAEVGERTGYSARIVRELYRVGRFPAPIDHLLHPKAWRWSPAVVDAYIAGEWKPTVRKSA